MEAAIATAPIKPTITKPIPPLSPSYEKAHKTYVLTSAWQLIGVSIETKGKWGVTLKSPAAIPLILISMVVYFGYKVIIECFQCDDRRREHPAARLDFRVAHSIALSALAITVIQYVSQRQIVDVLAKHLNAVAVAYDSCLIVAILIITTFVKKKTRRRPVLTWVSTAVCLIPAVLLGITIWKAQGTIYLIKQSTALVY